MPPIRLLQPTVDLLDRYAAALRHGFQPSAGGGTDLAELREIEADPRGFVRARADLGAHLVRQRWVFDIVACDLVGLVAFTRKKETQPWPALVQVVIAPWWRQRGYGSHVWELALRSLLGGSAVPPDDHHELVHRIAAETGVPLPQAA